MEGLNKKFSVKKTIKDKLLYILEIAIKIFQNTELLYNYIYMDIPALNEAKTNYIEDIFYIINLDNFLFEIFIFGSNSFKLDKMLNIIIKDINIKNVTNFLRGNGNIYILNKIDSIGGENSIIDYLKYHF